MHFAHSSAYIYGMYPHFVEYNGALFFSVMCTVAPSLSPPLYRGDITRIILCFGATLCVTPFTEHNARYLLLLLLRDVLVAPFLSLCPPFCILGDIIRIFFGATLCVYTALVCFQGIHCYYLTMAKCRNIVKITELVRM